MCASLSVHDLPPCAATLKQGHAMVLSHQGHDPVMVVTLVLAVSVITRLEAKVRYRKYGTVTLTVSGNKRLVRLVVVIRVRP